MMTPKKPVQRAHALQSRFQSMKIPLENGRDVRFVTCQMCDGRAFAGNLQAELAWKRAHAVVCDAEQLVILLRARL
jgi:hypothetical protein